MSGRGQYDTALVFVAIFTLIGMALSLYGLVLWAERRTLAWQHRTEILRVSMTETEKL